MIAKGHIDRNRRLQFACNCWLDSLIDCVPVWVTSGVAPSSDFSLRVQPTYTTSNSLESRQTNNANTSNESQSCNTVSLPLTSDLPRSGQHFKGRGVHDSAWPR
ncbi:hypothetical protein CY34DRAFT_174867 [Suillus luteus UH-Slu-Lm8-n1]|uniref:Uncharacterized protein n=1 Tax=Suillus luteus UH-Slu-Lm8-n1 TaxID=930992 RepID=A0A0C9ZVX1_9AGAM|nr:hypothetical protein CY34DRAFT_174867 [Suillus luteus UH-Slu-Lm8-n1]